MVISMNFVIKGNSKSFSLINIVTFIFIVCIFHPRYNKSTFGNYIGKKNNDINILDTFLHRSLSKCGYKEKGELTNLKDELSYDRDMKREKNCSDAMFTYSSLKKKGLSPLELYKKSYKNRHSKKKGLSKLDCYWEKIIFDKIDQVNILAEKTQNSKKRFLKKILNKYTISLFLLALTPYLGLILPAMFGDEDAKNRFMKVHFGDCTEKDATKNNACKNGLIHVSAEWAHALTYINFTLILVSIIIFISIMTYTAVKFIKYEFLKYGLGNVTLKKCFRVCKNAF